MKVGKLLSFEAKAIEALAKRLGHFAAMARPVGALDRSMLGAIASASDMLERFAERMVEDDRLMDEVIEKSGRLRDAEHDRDTFRRERDELQNRIYQMVHERELLREEEHAVCEALRKGRRSSDVYSLRDAPRAIEALDAERLSRIEEAIAMQVRIETLEEHGSKLAEWVERRALPATPSTAEQGRSDAEQDRSVTEQSRFVAEGVDAVRRWKKHIQKGPAWYAEGEFVGTLKPDSTLPPFFCIAESPVFREGWYFWSETWTKFYGPFETRWKAAEAMRDYHRSLG